MKQQIKEVAIEAFKAGALIGLVLVFVGLMIRVVVGNEPTIQANSPEDFFREGRSRSECMAELVALKSFGANQRFTILHNIGGDGNNANAFLSAPAWMVDTDFLDEVAATIREANAIGMSFEVALFESENARGVPRGARIALAREVGARFRGLDVVVNIAEECTLRGDEVTELVNAIHKENPSQRVVIHNWPEATDDLLPPLIGSGLYGVSGQVHHPSDSSNFIEEWRGDFPFVGIAEVGPWNVGFPPGGDYFLQRQALYSSLMSSGFVGIYYGVAYDLGEQDASRWAGAYAQANVAAILSTMAGQVYRPDLGAGSPAIAVPSGDEIRAYHHVGIGHLALAPGEWIIHRHDPATGFEQQPETIEVKTHGLVALTSGETLVIARTTRRDAAFNFLQGTASDYNGDGVSDVSDSITRR